MTDGRTDGIAIAYARLAYMLSRAIKREKDKLKIEIEIEMAEISFIQLLLKSATWLHSWIN